MPPSLRLVHHLNSVQFRLVFRVCVCLSHQPNGLLRLCLPSPILLPTFSMVGKFPSTLTLAVLYARSPFYFPFGGAETFDVIRLYH